MIGTKSNWANFMKQDCDTKFKEAINQISKILLKNHFSYQQSKYIFAQARHKARLKPQKSQKGIKPHLSQEEAQKLINHAYNSTGKIGLMLKTLLFNGTRVNEFVNIKIEHVYLHERKIWIEKAKGGKPRYVPIFSFYLHELTTYIADRKIGYLFESNRNTKYSTRRIQQIVKKLSQKAGIKKCITPHRLRATIATWLYEKGMHKDDIQMFLGHERSDTTEIYIKGSVKKIGDIGDKLLLQAPDENTNNK